MRNQISGIFSDTLAKCAHWFLYIFIAPDAKLNKSIMAKRKRQIAVLQWIDKYNGVYNYSQLVDIIRGGIVQKYKLTPDKVLSVLYTAGRSSVSGIGTFKSPYFDGTNWLDGDGNILSEAEQLECTKIAQDINNQNGSSNFWLDFKNIVEWIVELLKSIGLDKNSYTVGTGTSDPNDWGDPDMTESAGFGDTLPYVIGGAILYTLFTNSKKKKTTTT